MMQLLTTHLRMILLWASLAQELEPNQLRCWHWSLHTMLFANHKNLVIHFPVVFLEISSVKLGIYLLTHLGLLSWHIQTWYLDQKWPLCGGCRPLLVLVRVQLASSQDLYLGWWLLSNLLKMFKNHKSFINAWRNAEKNSYDIYSINYHHKERTRNLQ